MPQVNGQGSSFHVVTPLSPASKGMGADANHPEDRPPGADCTAPFPVTFLLQELYSYSVRAFSIAQLSTNALTTSSQEPVSAA